MNIDFNSLLMPCIFLAIVMVVIFSEMIKRFDTANKFKGYRVYFPFLISGVFSAILWIGGFFPLKQIPLYWATIFGISSFGYEAIVKQVKNKLMDKEKPADNVPVDNPTVEVNNEGK